MAKKITPTQTFVTVINTQGASALVEYESNGLIERKYVPINKINNGFVSDEVLASGIPYGYPWRELDFSFDMALFEKEMHNADLWTPADVQANPKKVTGVLRTIFEDHLRAVLDAANQERKRRV